MKDVAPIFRKAYDVPYRLKDKVSAYLDKLEREKVITPIDTSEWASPIIIVMKKNSEIRLVIDCKVSLNKAIIPNTYLLLKIFLQIYRVAEFFVHWILRERIHN